MRSLLTGALLLLAPAGCAIDAPAELQAIATALRAGDLEAIAQKVHPDYSDARGDKQVLLSDLRSLVEAAPRIELRFLELDYSRVPRAQLSVYGRVEVWIEGTSTLKLVGPLQLELVREGKVLIRTGLLDDLRDIRALLVARVVALEANDPKAYGVLLHPQYRDGDLDRDGAIARLEKELPGTRIRCRVVHQRIEVRGPKAHVDERFVLSVGEVELPERTARLTLERSAGRWRFVAGLFAAP